MAVRGTAADAVHLQDRNVLIEIFEFKAGGAKPQGPDRPEVHHGFNHINLAVTDLNSEYGRLKKAGMNFHSPPVQIMPGIRTVYRRDPFGNVMELEEVQGRKLANESAASISNAS